MRREKGVRRVERKIRSDQIRSDKSCRQRGRGVLVRRGKGVRRVERKIRAVARGGGRGVLMRGVLMGG